MKRTVCILAAALLLCLSLFPMAFASGAKKPRMNDSAELIPDSEEAVLAGYLDNYSAEFDMDIVIVTMDSIGDQDPVAFADDFFDYNGFGEGTKRGGILLLVALESRDVVISTAGQCLKLIPNEECDTIRDHITYDLSSGNYANACEKFVFDVADQMESVERRPLMILVASVVIGFIVSSVIVSGMKNKLKSVSMRAGAADYTVPGSMVISRSDDRFLYNNVVRTRIENDSSRSSGGSHTSSSGASHGGSSGKF